MKILVVISTGGAVINEVINYPIMQENIYYFLADRDCGGINVAIRNNISYEVHNEKDSIKFSDYVLDFARKNNIDYIYSFYLKLFKGQLLEEYCNKIINFHPSILPAFTGFNPIKRAVNYNSKVTGTTIHFIDNTTDQGTPILQSITSIPDNITEEELTHKLFVHQCKSILQLTKWLQDKKISVKENRCFLKDSKYEVSEFYPNLDYTEAIKFDKKYNH